VIGRIRRRPKDPNHRNPLGVRLFQWRDKSSQSAARRASWRSKQLSILDDLSPIHCPTERLGSLIKVRDRHSQHMGNVKKPCGAHPIASVLIFLDLLKCYGKSISQQRLRHILSPARIPYTLPDLGINVPY
jgi:hypothetical protein